MNRRPRYSEKDSCSLTAALWDLDDASILAQRCNNEHMRPYSWIFRYYASDDNTCFKPLHLAKHEHLRKLVHHLRNNKDKSLKDLCEALPPEIITEDAPQTQQRSIGDMEAAIRRFVGSWLRIDSEDVYSPNVLERTGLRIWASNMSLQSYLSTLFPSDAPGGALNFDIALQGLDLEKGLSEDLRPSSIRLTAHPRLHQGEEWLWPRSEILKKTLSNGYFRIRWTNFLPDHLRMTRDYEDKMPAVYLFHHASFLEHSGAAQAVLPPGLIAETRSTLALFLPKDNRKVQNWFKKENGKERAVHVPLDRQVIKQDCSLDLDLRNYKFWGPRLKRIKCVLEAAKPGTAKQKLIDWRAVDREWSLKIAVVALVLTTVFSFVQLIIQIEQRS